VRDKDYISTGYEHIFTGNTYLSCLYHTILGNRNGVGFPYFIKASYAGNLQWLVEPTTKPFYFDQNLIDNAMNIPCFTRNDADKTVNEVNE
jgi:hypothetical protein